MGTQIRVVNDPQGLHHIERQDPAGAWMHVMTLDGENALQLASMLDHSVSAVHARRELPTNKSYAPVAYDEANRKEVK